MFRSLPSYVLAVDVVGIQRSLDEQNYEAIQLLSMAVESSLAKQSRSLSRKYQKPLEFLFKCP